MEKYRFDSETKRTLEKLRTPLAVYQFIHKKAVTVLLSDGFCDMFDFDDRRTAFDLMERDMFDFTHPDDKARASNEAYRFATQGGKYEVVYRTMTYKRSDYIVVHAIGEHVYTDDGVRLAFIWYTNESTYTSEADSDNISLRSAIGKALREEIMVNASYFDFLTGLPSMGHFFELAREWYHNEMLPGDTAAVLYLDFCDMKFYNRKYGFAQGDKLLRAFADILRKHFNTDNCSRFGSDHFCVYAKAQGLETKLEQVFLDFQSEEALHPLPVRAGIYRDTSGLLDINTLCDRAKYACDTLRNVYCSDYRYFSAEMLSQMEIRQYIIDNLDKAIREEWIQVYHQPLIRSANGRVCDEEGLARWIDPVRGVLTPKMFIPVLEESNLIYKLDLYVTEQILKKLKRQKKEGLYVVSECVNLSRSDFTSCDIVEEIRKRVDTSGLERRMLNIEVTESTVGSDFSFMKKQIERFRSLGFRVWMDDFGSGYSSLDVLQSIRFDVIKFDMHFMKEFHNGSKSRIMLTELVRMAITLGVETVCEGVETKEQADFLREIGCTMMQGFYFCRAIPIDAILERYRKGIQIGFENPEESAYYVAIGKINLYDLSTVSNGDKEAFEHYFNTLPMAIIETGRDTIMLMRCNNSFRTFMERVFGYVPLGKKFVVSSDNTRLSAGFLNAVRSCAVSGNQQMLDEEVTEDSVAHFLLKRIAVNPVNNTKALAIAILAVTDASKAPITFTGIAKSLSSDYISLYYVNLHTDKFIEYRSATGLGELAAERRGEDFFAEARKDAASLIHAEDSEMFIRSFTKENILKTIDTQGSYTLSYRLLIDGVPNYVNIKAVRIKGSTDYIIIGVNNVDVQMRQKETLERMVQERITFSRITALSDNYICIYTIDPKTDSYIEYIATHDYAALGVPKQGDDFFGISHQQSHRLVHPDDVANFNAQLTKDNILSAIKANGRFIIHYRMELGGKTTPVCLRGALVEEADGPQLIIGVIVEEHHFDNANSADSPGGEAH